MRTILAAIILFFTAVTALSAAQPPEKYRTVSAARAVAEFKKHYSVTGRKIIRAVYVGRPRQFTETELKLPVDFRAHLVSADVLHEECGLVSRETWEIHYYRTGEEWRFKRLQFVSHREIKAPSKKIPYLPDLDAKSLISNEFAARNEIQVRDMVIEQKKGTREFCVPSYDVRARAIIAVKDPLVPTMRNFDCRVFARIRRYDAEWQVTEISCLTSDGKKEGKMPCSYPTACKELPVESVLPDVDGAVAMEMLRKEYSAQYAFQRDRGTIARFILIWQLPRENNGTVIPFLIRTRIHLDRREYYDTEVGGKPVKTYRSVRTVYDCTVHAHLSYSYYRRQWVPEIINCATSGTKRCGLPWYCPVPGCTPAGNR